MKAENNREKCTRKTDYADFSYLDIKNLTDPLLAERKAPRSDGRSLVKIIRLSNNSLWRLKGLGSFLVSRLHPLQKIAWIDLSHNRIAQLDQEELLRLPNLQVLYLHCNCLDNFDELLKLSALKSLQILTVYGNPVETSPDYRLRVIGTLPRLRRIDFTPVTPREKYLSKVYEIKRKKGEPAESTKETKKSGEVSKSKLSSSSETRRTEHSGFPAGQSYLETGSGEEEVGEEEEYEIDQLNKSSYEMMKSEVKSASMEDPTDLMPSWAKDEWKKATKIYYKLKEAEAKYQFNYYE